MFRTNERVISSNSVTLDSKKPKVTTQNDNIINNNKNSRKKELMDQLLGDTKIREVILLLLMNGMIKW